ncbi:MAG: hypothetical protein D6702_05460, partial [Planctomycetota bacterium]
LAASRACGSFVDRLADLAAERGGDAAALLAAVRRRRDDRVKGFRRENEEKLAAFLVENGLLDPRPRLDREGLVRVALGAAERWIRDGAASPAAVRDWVGWLLLGDPAGAGAAEPPTS